MGVPSSPSVFGAHGLHPYQSKYFATDGKLAQTTAFLHTCLVVAVHSIACSTPQMLQQRVPYHCPHAQPGVQHHSTQTTSIGLLPGRAVNAFRLLVPHGSKASRMNSSKVGGTLLQSQSQQHSKPGSVAAQCHLWLQRCRLWRTCRHCQSHQQLMSPACMAAQHSRLDFSALQCHLWLQDQVLQTCSHRHSHRQLLGKTSRTCMLNVAAQKEHQHNSCEH